MILSIRNKRKLAVVIPAHDEEPVLLATLKSAVRSGQKRRDIYVVDDGSHDCTANIALSYLGLYNVLSVPPSGKEGAIKQLVDHYNLTGRYHWIHIADADSAFGKSYFRIFRKKLDLRYAAATGYIRSLQGDFVSQYRVYEYAWGLEVLRRFQALLGIIPIIPGPTACFRSDVFEKLEDGGTLTGDFDLTMQVHRGKLGKIQYIPQAKTYTQDPQNYRDFVKQITRWYRGLFQGIRRHRVGLRPQKVDLYIVYQLLQAASYFLVQVVYLPILAIITHSPSVLAIAFLIDVIMTFALTVWAASVSRRWDIVSAFPFFFVLRWTYLFVLIKAFGEVMILNRYRDTSPGWSVQGRRYQISAEAVTNA